MSKKNPKKDKPAPQVEETEEQITESTDTSETVEIAKSKIERPKQSAKSKISFLFCKKCGNQTTDLSEKSCSTCKGDLEPAYSSNPQD